MNEKIFKNLINARRIASIANDIKEMLESLSFATANRDTIMYIIQRVRERHGDKVAQSLAEEIPHEIRNDVDLFRVRNIVNIARGFLAYREFQKKTISELTNELLSLKNKEIVIRAVPDTAASTPWRESVHNADRGLLLCYDDLQRAGGIQRRIKQIQEEIGRKEEEYFL